MIYVFAKKLARFATGVSFHPSKGFTYIFCRSVYRIPTLENHVTIIKIDCEFVCKKLESGMGRD